MDFRRPESKWIWTDLTYDKAAPVVVYLREELLLTERPKRAVVKLSADSRYRFYVNGACVCMGPCKGDRQIWYYDEVDIAPYLQEGKNVLAAAVLRYPVENDNGNHAVWRTLYPGFYLDGIIEETGGGRPIFTGEDWHCYVADHLRIEKANVYFEPLCITETVSGEGEPDGWKLPGYQETDDWRGAVAYAQVSEYVSPGRLDARPIPLLYEKKARLREVMCVREGSITKEQWESWLRDEKPLRIPPNSREVVELHAGELMTAYLELRLAGGRGSRLALVCAESYIEIPDELELPTGIIRDKNLISLLGRSGKGDRLDWRKGKLFGATDRYTASGHGTEEQPEYYEPFWFRTFRFVQLKIETGDEELILCPFTYRETGYPLEVKTKVATSDKSLSDIWDICERTLRRCMHETYEDCPYYEQLQYIMDTRSQILFTYMTSADDRLARKSIEDFARSQRYDGLLEGCYPSYGPNTICNFSIYYILMVWDHYQFFKEDAFTERLLPVLERILQFFGSRLTEKGLVRKTSEGGQSGRYWSFIDWVSSWERGVPNAIKHGEVTMESLLYCLGLQTLAELERHFEEKGYGALAQRHEQEAAQLRESIRTYCMDEKGLLMDGAGFAEYSQHCQVFGTLTGVFTKEEAHRAMETAMCDTSFARCSVAMMYYLFRALQQTGMYEQTDHLWDNWRNMLAANLTTCVESDGIEGRSDCHAWGALALYELPAVILGVYPAEPGWEKIAVRPIPGVLSYAEGEVITPKGMVKVKWQKREDGTLELSVQAPEGCRVETE